MDETITYVGLDAHKKTISVAVAEPGRDGVVRSLGSVANQPATVARLAKKLAAAHGKLRFCYEAGPCGYGLHRQLTALGHDCVVAAPSLIPRRPGERVKTDRRDAITLARSDRAGELTLVWVPDPAHEAMRDLVRGREQAVAELRRHRQHLQALLLRHGRIWLGKNSWTRAHLAWIKELTWQHPAHRILVDDHLAAITAALARRDRLTREIAALVPDWRWAPVVRALQAMRGIALISAVSLVAAIGDVSRFQTARQLMGYLGLVPSEHSSGPKRRQGGITKAGNNSARRVLVEGAWTYRSPPRLNPAMQARQTGLPKAVREIAWKAQQRLCARYRTLAGRGKPNPVIATAIAREMVGFIWAIARAAQPDPR
jgi:transposase